MKATLDHIGIAVKDLAAALAFYRDALGLEIESPEEVSSQQVRARFVRVGESKLELLEATGAPLQLVDLVAETLERLESAVGAGCLREALDGALAQVGEPSHQILVPISHRSS